MVNPTPGMMLRFTTGFLARQSLVEDMPSFEEYLEKVVGLNKVEIATVMALMNSRKAFAYNSKRKETKVPLKRYQSPIQGAMGSQYQQAPPGRQPRGSKRGMKIAQLEMIAEGKMLHLECGYNPDFVSALKNSIPSKKRYYDAGDQTWYVVADQYEKLAILLDRYFDDTILINFPAQTADSDAWTQLWLVEGAPLEVIRAAYKALALLHHPDKGGDPEVMTRVNVAYKELLGELANGKDEEEKGD